MSDRQECWNGSNYLPIAALPYWEHLGPFVHEVVDRCLTETSRDSQSLYAALTPFVLWCWQTCGYELTIPTVFRAATVERFIHLRTTSYTRGSRATLRSTLLRALEVLAPAEANKARHAIPRSIPNAPYTAREVAALHSWANRQRTDHRRLDALALVGLGFGAGLATRELLRVGGADCATGSAGLVVTVEGGRAREVPVAAEWQATLREVIDARPEHSLFRPDRASAAEGQVTDFILRSRTPLDVRPARMRTTWLQHHLINATDPVTLRRISGLKTLASLDKIAHYAPSTGAISGPFSTHFGVESASDRGFIA